MLTKLKLTCDSKIAIFRNAIRAKYEDYRVYEIAHVYYLNFSNNNMLKVNITKHKFIIMREYY